MTKETMERYTEYATVLPTERLMLVALYLIQTTGASTRNTWADIFRIVVKKLLDYAFDFTQQFVLVKIVAALAFARRC
jgi:hypothetical protein